jgi:predicted acylesterase/phospholipase RssA
MDGGVANNTPISHAVERITPIEFDRADELIERALEDARDLLASEVRLGSQTSQTPR